MTQLILAAPDGAVVDLGPSDLSLGDAGIAIRLARAWLGHFTHYYSPVSRTTPKSLFAELAATWREDTTFLSSTDEIISHPAYEEIIAMGKDSVPLILEDLAQKHGQWFTALVAITGEDPVPAADKGNVSAMTNAWLTWGRQRGLLA